MNGYILEKIISYLSDSFNNDTDIENEIGVVEAYSQRKQVIPEITVNITSDSEVVRYNTFSGENVSQYSVQITSYTEQMTIGGELKSAQDAANIFSEKVRALFQKQNLITAIPEIVYVRRVGRTFAIPQIKGAKVYMSPVRFEIQTINQ